MFIYLFSYLTLRLFSNPMKTQIITFKKEHLHFIWRLFLLCSVFICSFSYAQVCIGNSLKFVIKECDIDRFSPIENKDEIHFIFPHKNKIITSGRKKVSRNMFRLNIEEKEYFFESYFQIAHSVITQNSDIKSKAFTVFLSYYNVRSINLGAIILKEYKAFTIITIKRSQFLPRPPPLV